MKEVMYAYFKREDFRLCANLRGGAAAGPSVLPECGRAARVTARLGEARPCLLGVLRSFEL